MASVVFGSIGLAPLVPFIAGFLLSARDALISTLYAACIALLLAGLGSASLMGWDIVSYGALPINSNFSVVLLQVISLPSTWIMILGWVIAAVACSLLCGTGKRVWCVLGMILAGACLIVALILGSLADTAGMQLLQNPFMLAPIIGCSVLGIVLGSVTIPARADQRNLDFE